MNGHRRRSAGKLFAASLAAALTVWPGHSAFAQEARAGAQGLVEITRGVGTGIAFDIATDALSSAFLAGEMGDAVSLLLPPRRLGVGAGRRVTGEVLVLSASSYPIDLSGFSRSSQDLAETGQGGAQLMPAGFGGAPGNLLFLAQFN